MHVLFVHKNQPEPTKLYKKCIDNFGCVLYNKYIIFYFGLFARFENVFLF